jgi:hypothetical protein
MVKDKGEHTFIDKVQVRYVSEDDKHWAELKNLGNKYVHIPEHFLREYDRLLMGGIWAQVDFRHQCDEEQKGKRSPFWIVNLKPIQLATFDLEEYRACRNPKSSVGGQVKVQFSAHNIRHSAGTYSAGLLGRPRNAGLSNALNRVEEDATKDLRPELIRHN